MSQLKTKKFSKEYENYFQSLKKSFFDGEKKKDPKYKTELCKNFFETGKYNYEFKCKFKHKKEELS